MLVRELLFQNFLLRQYLQRQTIAIVFEFDPHFLIRHDANYKIIDLHVIDWANATKIHTPPSG